MTSNLDPCNNASFLGQLEQQQDLAGKTVLQNIAHRALQLMEVKESHSLSPLSLAIKLSDGFPPIESHNHASSPEPDEQDEQSETEEFPTLTPEILNTDILKTYINDIPPEEAHQLPEISSNAVPETVSRLREGRAKRKQAEWSMMSNFERRQEMRRWTEKNAYLMPRQSRPPVSCRQAAENFYARRAEREEMNLRRTNKQHLRRRPNSHGPLDRALYGRVRYHKTLYERHAMLLNEEQARQEQIRQEPLNKKQKRQDSKVPSANMKEAMENVIKFQVRSAI